MKKLLLMFAAVGMLFTACNNEPEHIYDDHSADIVGTWSCLTANYAEVLIINADGTAVSYGVEDGEYWENVRGTVVTKGGNITMTFEDNDNLTGHFDIVPKQSFSLFEDSGERYTYQYCANDLADEVVGMWVCTYVPWMEADMAINVYQADGKAFFTGFVGNADFDYASNVETTYKVIGDLMFQSNPMSYEGAPKYLAFRMNYSPNGSEYGDVLTNTNIMAFGDETIETTASMIRIKQSLDLNNKNYDYSNIYVTNVKGEDKEFEFAGQTLNFSTLDGSVMDKLMKHILFNVSFTSGKISYNCYYNGANKSIDAPIEVDGNKVTIKMSENNSVYRDIEMYMFQDAKNTQLHMYMPTKSFEKFFGNISVATMAKEGKLDLNDASAVKAVFDNIENAIESINVSFIFKDPTRAL